ncbi:MAG: glycosyltransferase family 39 protein [Chloroflexi bacterium]|nr:glycosyltransferase family 39 protein [Chloroflexota bacterium]MBP7042034.1 glycosyltransferase family 39 protein [Chloroflexota bacterium]
MRRFFTWSPRYILLLAILLAAFLRLWRFSELPPGLYHDEAYNGLDALSLVQGKSFPQFYEGWELYAQDAHGDHPPAPTRWPVFFEGNYGREPLHVYLMALSIWLFGATPQAIRLVPALAGILAVLTTYLAAKELLADEAASPYLRHAPLLAAFSLAILYPAVHFSRFGIRPMLFVPVETLTVYFFWRGIHRAERAAPSFLWAGFFLGVGIYTYAVARLFPLLFVAFVPLWFWQDRAALARHGRHVALMAGASLVTALPLLLFFARYPYFFVFRLAYVANKGLGAVEGRPWLTWLNNVWRVIGGLFWQGETHLRHNLPGRPYLDPLQAVLFGVGVVGNGRFWRKRHLVFLFIWLGVMLLPTILSGDAPHFGRMVGIAPVAAIFIALGLVQVAQWTAGWAAARSPWAKRWLVWAAWALLLGGSLFLTVRDYFFRYAHHPQLAEAFYVPDWEMGRYAAAQPPDTAVYLTPTQEEMATIYFAMADPERLRSYSGGSGLIPAGLPGASALYLVRPTDAASWQALTDFYPDYQADQTRPDFWSLLAPDSVAQARQTAVTTATAVSFADTIHLLGWTAVMDGDQLRLTLVWQAQAEMSLAYTAYVHVLDANGQMVAQLDRQPAGYPTPDWRPGEVVVDTFAITLPAERPSGPFTLATGFYDLATLAPLGETAVLTETWTP